MYAKDIQLHLSLLPAGSSEATGPNVAVPALAHRIEMLRAASSSHSFARSAGSARSTGRTSTVTPYCWVSRPANALEAHPRGGP